ncbi:MAG: hypothetical protein L0323_18380 [Planctomycetes bacterium]|nr:hypothetical protein [Planctomycetota bacterium]
MRVPSWPWRFVLVVAAAAPVVGYALFGVARPLDEAIKGMPRTGRPVRLVVNGEEIPAAAFDRAFVYIHGRPYLERKIRDFLVAEEIELRRRSGQAVEDLRISDEEVRKEVASRKEEFQRQIQGGLDLDAFLRAQGMDETSFADEQASLLRFDKAFIPDDTTKWSGTTRKALASEGEQAVVDLAIPGIRARGDEALAPQGGKESVDRPLPGLRPPVVEATATGSLKDPALQELVDRTIQAIREQGERKPDAPIPRPPVVEAPGTERLKDPASQELVDRTTQAIREQGERKPNAPIPPFYRTIFRQWITKALRKSSNIRTASDGLPPDVVLTVNGRPLLTAEAYPAIARRVTALDRENVVRWMAWATATRQALVKAGVFLPEEEFAREWQAHVGPYEETPFSIEVVAIAFKKFPSYDLYREYFRLKKSFEKRIEKEVTDETLLQHRARVQGFLEDGKVDAQVILLSAFDYTNLDWKGPDAFDEAKARAEETLAALKAGTSFEEAIDRFSEFVDRSAPPPNAPPGRRLPEGPRTNRGRFGAQSKNQLKQLLGESEFEDLLRGTSMGEILFHDAAPLEVVGPMRGPTGYYIGRVLERLPGAKPVDFTQENTRDLLREDYLRRRFIDWSADVVAESRFKIR